MRLPFSLPAPASCAVVYLVARRASPGVLRGSAWSWTTRQRSASAHSAFLESLQTRGEPFIGLLISLAKGCCKTAALDAHVVGGRCASTSTLRGSTDGTRSTRTRKKSTLYRCRSATTTRSLSTRCAVHQLALHAWDRYAWDRISSLSPPGSPGAQVG